MQTQTKVNEYLLICEQITPADLARIIESVKKSKDLEIDEYSHIIAKETGARIAYIGNDSLDLFDFPNKALRPIHYEVARILNSSMKDQSPEPFRRMREHYQNPI